MTRAVRPPVDSSPVTSGVERGAEPAWLRRTLGRLLEHIRALVKIDCAAYLVVDPARGWIEPLADWFSSPELRAALGLKQRIPYDAGNPSLMELTVERDRPFLLPRIDAWEAAPSLRAAAVEKLGEEREALVWEVYRHASVISCPVKTSLGRTLGVLMVGSLDAEHPLGGGELRIVEVLADLSALALERAELLEAEARRAREELQLKRASEAMSATLEPQEVYRRAVEHAARVTGGAKAFLTRLDVRGRELTVVASVDFGEHFEQRRLPLERGSLGQVARTRTPYVSRSSDSVGWDDGVAAPERIGSFMHAPIELGPRLFGVLTVTHERIDHFGEADLELLVKLARSAAAAIANAIDFERERRIAQALTLGFVPESLAEVPGYEVGLLYAPASGEPTGGDVYGAWRLPTGEVAVLIGDVAGKGVETAALSSMVRFFVEARSWDSAHPSEILEQANTMVLSRLPDDAFVTALLAILGSGSLRYSNAGHHLPLLLSSSGQPIRLRGHGLPLGVHSTPQYGETELELRPDDLVFAYTDGLIEARCGSEVYGLERLTRVVAERRELPLEELVGTIHEEVAGWADGLADDAVALAFRRRP